MKCNYCEHKKVKFNGRNNHYVVCGRTDGFVGYCNVAPQRYMMKPLCRTGARQKLRRKQSSLKLC